MKKTAFFGGTFDPIHFGHINLAIQIKEKAGFDAVLFCPANISPHKTDSPPLASSKDRLDMVELAIKDIEGFSICDLEVKRDGPSYTIDTLKKLKKDGVLNLILTEDSLLQFHLWKNFSEIINIAPPVVGVRYSFKVNPNNNFKIPGKNFIKTTVMEISSTEIRERVKNKLYCGHLISQEVLDYIYKHNLYC
jgi:nicotinate-nucleotide adenylyltransferase